MQNRQQNTVCHTTIQNDNPWKLQQVQDAANHLQQAIFHIDDVDKNYKFRQVLILYATAKSVT